jgi:hypothetical protein
VQFWETPYMPSTIVVPVLQIRSSSIIEYNSYEYSDLRPRARQDEFTKNLLNQTTYTGLLTPGAKRRLTKAAELLIQLSKEHYVVNPKTGKYRKFRLAFLTLVVSDINPKRSKEVQKTCLAPFIQWLRRVKGCTMFLWKAELQQRGQIHYHFTINVFIDKDEVRAKWNELQRKAGYLERHHDIYHNWSPPSTEIKDVKHYERIASYISKKVESQSKVVAQNIEREQDAELSLAMIAKHGSDYHSITTELTKDFQNRHSVYGKIWDCSMSLKKAKYFSVELDGEYADSLIEMEKSGELQRVKTDSCTIYKFFKKPPCDMLKPKDRKEFNSAMNAIKWDKLNVVKPIVNLKPPPIAESRFKKVNIKVQLDLFSSS